MNLNKHMFGVTVLALLLGAGAADAGPKPSLSFAPLQVPVTDAEKRAVRASGSVEIAGKGRHAIGFHTLLRSGDRVGGAIFGRLTDGTGAPVRGKNGAPEVSNRADFSSLLVSGGKLYNLTHFESRPGAMYLSELKQDASGALTAISTRPIDFSSVGGLWTPCAGSVTPWGSHLGSEEYPPNARAFGAAGSMSDVDKYTKDMVRYFGLDPDKASLDEVRSVFNPYAYGYPTEVAVDAEGNALPVKQYAMGRVSVELAYVMADRKTVYITDDGTNVGLYMFVADKADDLSAGRLYALKWTQTGTANGGSAEVTWIDLGHATDHEIAARIKGKIKFADIFETARGDKTAGTCPGDFSPVNTMVGFECLRVKQGMETVASRIETRRYAGLRGATTEFRKMEGFTFDPDRNTAYLAMSAITRGMEDNRKKGKPTGRYDAGNGNHVRLPYNACGTVYRLKVGRDAAIGSDYVAKSISGEVSGRMAGDAGDNDNMCDVDGIANPDNLTFVTGHDTLIIGEDTNAGHQNDAFWAYDVETKHLTRIQTAPYGSETTSAYWYPDVGGFGYLMSVVQHPYGESDRDKLRDPSEAAAYVGYIGPFPKLD